MTLMQTIGATPERLPEPGSAQVYAPQEDTRLLIEACRDSGRLPGATMVDLCTGSGAVAAAGAEFGAAEVTAVDLSAAAVQAAAAALAGASCPARVYCADLAEVSLIQPLGTVDVLTCNPPYVPTAPVTGSVDPDLGPVAAWDGGTDGRRVLDPLCALAPRLLAPGGVLLLVQSELSGVTQTLRALRRGGLNVRVERCRSIPFGPVLRSRARWLVAQGLIPPGTARERLVVVRGERPARDGRR